MVYTLSYQMYKYEHGLTAAEQRAADVRAGEAAAALRDLRLHLGRTFRPRAPRAVGPRGGGRDDRVGTGRVECSVGEG
jgi:hypothetical protein